MAGPDSKVARCAVVGDETVEYVGHVVGGDQASDLDNEERAKRTNPGLMRALDYPS